jgi:molybdopterin-guanine dinucleotide biosynthesis protein A
VTRSDAIAAIVLAGGRATRIGGGDKPLRAIDGRSMLSLVLERLSPQVGPIAISANGDPARFAEYRLPVLADEAKSRQAGPLAGVLSGMAWAKASTRRRLLTVAGDTPFFPVDMAWRLDAAVTGHEQRIAIAASRGRRHPVFALWPVSLEADLRAFLAGSQTLSVSAFLDRHDAISVDFPMAEVAGRSIDPFLNVNTPEDLAEAESIVRGEAP